MRINSLFELLLGVERTVVEEVDFEVEDERVVVHVRPRKGATRRCGRCGRRAAWFDRGEGRWRWRALDLGPVQAEVEADAPRVNCPEHGPTVVAVPWARHKAGHTFMFDGQVAWLAVHTSKTAVNKFFDLLGEQRCAQITHVSADGADWIANAVDKRCPNAVRGADPFYGDLRVMPMWLSSCLVGAVLAERSPFFREPVSSTTSTLFGSPRCSTMYSRTS